MNRRTLLTAVSVNVNCVRSLEQANLACRAPHWPNLLFSTTCGLGKESAVLVPPIPARPACVVTAPVTVPHLLYPL